MRRFLVFSIVVLSGGCFSSRKVTLGELCEGMALSDVRAVAGRLEWVGSTPLSRVYRGEFAKKADCGFFCRSYPALLTFDNDGKLTGFWRDRSEERRRRAEREERHEMRRCDSCDYGRGYGRGGRSYSGQGFNRIYRSISGYGQGLHSHAQD